MTSYEKFCLRLRKEQRARLITGVAGFIGSNLLEALLKLDRRAVGLDNSGTLLKIALLEGGLTIPLIHSRPRSCV
jgi:nucleoside-diphosphate-sugar epimerase